jgi:hypothetical protein
MFVNGRLIVLTMLNNIWLRVDGVLSNGHPGEKMLVCLKVGVTACICKSIGF